MRRICLCHKNNMEELIQLESTERSGRGRRPDVVAPMACQGCLTSYSSSISRKWGFICVYANIFFYSIKLLTRTAGMISLHIGKSA